jgi:hypothetical protein
MPNRADEIEIYPADAEPQRPGVGCAHSILSMAVEYSPSHEWNRSLILCLPDVHPTFERLRSAQHCAGCRKAPK